ncbi:MAG: DUF5103 domain-containing protein [Tannerella sp.]|jgi:hypothetical protein|nr:DUF5103 domain-containing protein [Tannerella sp.]
MNRWTVCVGIWALAAGMMAQAQEVYRTEVFSGQVKSLQVKVAGELISAPFLELEGEAALEVSFDVLNHAQGRFAYSVVHCNSDWTKSALMPVEYMDGFQGMPLDDYAQAMVTTTHYTNFRLELPNENMRFRISGNYALQVYHEDAPEKVLFTARFFVYESLVGIRSDVRSNTDIAFNGAYQQLSFRIDHRNMSIVYPQTDLKISVFQNGRTDNTVVGLQPSLVLDRETAYEHVPALIFEGGNEYRRVEFLTHRYNGLGIEQIRYFNPYYHADVATDRSRDRQGGYLYDEDQNGRFFVNCSRCSDPDTEADYYIVHFTYASERMPGGELYLLGDFVQNRFDANSLMEYNPQTRQYEKALLMKQGYYNYQYVFVPDGETKGSTQPAEGSYFQTENEYTIAVYFRPTGARFDRLIGISTIISK